MILSESTILDAIRKKANRPLKVSELAKCLSIEDDQKRDFRNWIKHLSQEGRLIRLKGGRYGLAEEMNLVTGKFQGHSEGYGFLIPENSEPDIFISRKNVKGAMHGDKVVVRVDSKGRGDSPEGRIVRILDRNTEQLVGLFEKFGREGWVIPSEPKYFQDIFIPLKERNRAKDGQLVVCQISEYPTPHHPPIGKIFEVLGDPDDPQVEIRGILKKHNVRIDFPPAVLKEARKISQTIEEEEIWKREDLRSRMIFTIDGAMAKDFDDAVSIEKKEDAYLLGVHIADVSHYIYENSPLDQEAYERGTSIYYPNSVIPMLPEELSNEICSLKPNVPRLTLSVEMKFDTSGQLLEHRLFNSVIQSKFRFTYEEVADIIASGIAPVSSEEALESLMLMKDLSQKLRKRRFKNGSVDFQIPEAEIILSGSGQVERIQKAEHNPAHELIEEFMLAANQAVAQDLRKKNIPFISRTHAPPNPEKISSFNDFIKSFGMRLNNANSPTPKDLQNLLKRIQGHPEERVINTLMLRSLKKALYSSKDSGHYCLAFDEYAHFTSPIRRYPDLVVHRLVKRFMNHKCLVKERKRLFPLMSDYADQSTAREIKAMEVEREMVDLRRAQFMANKVGEHYSGLITGVTAFGFFVELESVFVEGLVHVSSLHDDYYLYMEDEHRLIGKHTGKSYRIGNTVQVRVQEVDIKKRRIDLSLSRKSGKKS